MPNLNAYPASAPPSTRARWEVLPTSARARKRDPGLLPWTVTRNGERIATFHIKSEAVAFAVTAARTSWKQTGQTATLKIKGRDGQVQTERSYGRDPSRFPS